MHKVICEEPRHGGGFSKDNRRANLPEELLPKCEGIRRPYRNRKWFGEHLGPLRRWLQSQTGRAWNDVYSEACQVIKADSVVRAHIKTHMLEMVERNTFIRDGEAWCFRGGDQLPIADLRGRWNCFYVHPETGILTELPHRSGGLSSYHRQQGRIQSVRRWESERLLLVLWKGLWFACHMKSFAETHFVPPFDALWKLRLCESHAFEAYGRGFYCLSKRQLSGKELKRYRLKNSPENGEASLDVVLGEDLVRRMLGSNGNPVRRCSRTASLR